MPKQPVTKRRSERSVTRASSLSSRSVAASTRPNPDSSVERAENAAGSSTTEALPANLSEEIKNLVSSAVQESVRELQANLASQLQPPQNHFAPMAQTLQTLEALGEDTPQPNLSLRASGPNSGTTSFDGGFTPEIPAAFVNTIQAGEFFDLSKLLSENLHGLVALGDSFHLAVGSDSTLRVQKGFSPKKKINNIESWTTAFTTYMRVILDKFPARARELVAYLELIRYAASNHQPMGWLLYDEKFRLKAANDKSISWSLIDLQLWMRVFTGKQNLPENSLFSHGPYSAPAGPATPRDVKCSNFNRGARCAFLPCRYSHTCSAPGCGGFHPKHQCPKPIQPPAILPAPDTHRPPSVPPRQ